MLGDARGDHLDRSQSDAPGAGCMVLVSGEWQSSSALLAYQPPSSALCTRRMLIGAYPEYMNAMSLGLQKNTGGVCRCRNCNVPRAGRTQREWAGTGTAPPGSFQRSLVSRAHEMHNGP